jgi:hypothetical protein
MAGLRVGTVGGGPTVQVARPGLGTGAVSLGGGDLSAQLETKQAACLDGFHVNASKFRQPFFSFCKRISSNTFEERAFPRGYAPLQDARCDSPCSKLRRVILIRIRETATGRSRVRARRSSEANFYDCVFRADNLSRSFRHHDDRSAISRARLRADRSCVNPYGLGA